MTDAYRDHEEAALSAVPRLRDENAALRAELDELKRRTETLETAAGIRPRARASRALLALGVLSLALGGATALFLIGSPHAGRRPHPVRPHGASGDAPYSPDAAEAALRSVDLSTCARLTGPKGVAYLSVVFAADGTVDRAKVEGAPFANTAIARCAEDAYRAARVDPFAGPPVSVHTTFSVGVPDRSTP